MVTWGVRRRFKGDGEGLECHDGIRTGTQQIEFRGDEELRDDVVC